MSLLDIAQMRKGTLRDGYSANKAGASVAETRVEYGTATADSVDGMVTIVMDNSTQSFEVPCESPISQGDRVSYISTRGKGKAVSVATLAQIAQEAEDVATATNQHFWSDTNGIHVSTDEAEPAGTRNILINSLGILLRKAAHMLVSISETAVAFYDGDGNGAANVTAQFGKNGSVIGYEDGTHLSLDSRSVRAIDKNGNVYFLVGDLRGSDGLATLVQTYIGDGTTRRFLTNESISELVSVFVHGSDVTSTTTYNGGSVTLQTAPAQGDAVIVTYKTANLCPVYTLGSRNQYGDIAPNSYVLGDGCEASANFSLAEGILSIASGYAAHAEGNSTEAAGDNSHAEGFETEASGACSHAQNAGAIAASDYQTSIGKWNVADSADTYALIVGNGTGDSNRSNALTVAWNGDITASGEVIDGYGNKLSEASGGGSQVVFYGTSTTAAATAAKVVSCSDFSSSDLKAGTVLYVRFTYAQTYNGNPTLNVNSTGAVSIKRNGTTNAARYEWVAGEVVCFVHDGTYWIIEDGGIATTTYYGMTKLSSAVDSTSAALAATPAAVKSAYDLASGKSAIGHTHGLSTATAQAVGTFTANTPTQVTLPTFDYETETIPSISAKTVVTGGSTTNIPNITVAAASTDTVTGVGTFTPNTPTAVTLPTLTTSTETVLTGFTANTPTAASVSSGVLTITAGTAASATSGTVEAVDTWTAGSVTAGTAAALTTTSKTFNTNATRASAGTPIEAYTSLTTGDSITVGTPKQVTIVDVTDEGSVTAGTAASLTTSNVTVLTSSTTDASTN